MKKIALFATVLFASTSVFAATLSNESPKAQKISVNGKSVTVQANGSSSIPDGAKVTYKGKALDCSKDCKINAKGKAEPASKQGASAAPAQQQPQAAAAPASSAQPQPTPAAARQAAPSPAAAPQTSN